MEANDALFKNLAEHPFYPFIQYNATPLKEMKMATRILRQRTKMDLKARARK